MINEFNEITIKSPEELLERIDEIERIFRHSKEYRHFLKFLKEDLSMRTCDFFCSLEEYAGLDFVEERIDLEAHHQIRLYELALIAGLYLLSKNEYITVYDVVNELILMHYEDMLPFVMLSTTIHQLYHAGKYKLQNETLHLGDYKKFISKYKNYITEDVIEHYKEIGENIKEDD